ncbi:MAG: autotransporter domain-containing protein [Elusimicrobiota bacterium]|nr:autotransporter domain-containing protein [Elusimicrobiota bacterium]
MIKRKLKKVLWTVFAFLFFYWGYAVSYDERIEILYGDPAAEYSGRVFQTGTVYGDFDGGAIWGEDNATLSIFNSSFVNNRVVATDYSINLYGGAVYLNSSSSTFVNVSFLDNRTTNGGALAFSGNNTVSFRGNISFNKNYATKKGGALYTYGGDVDISDADNLLFENNFAPESGGAIMVNDGSLSIIADNISFIDNQSLASASDGGGGAIKNNGTFYMDAQNITFRGNAIQADITTARGGAVYVVADFTMIGNNNIVFENNFARNGGAIEVDSNLYIYSDNLEFINNTGNRGGALMNVGNSFIGYTDSATPNEGNIVFKDNVAQSSGGAIYIQGGTVYLSGNIKFINNRAAGVLNDIALESSLTIADGSTVSFDGGVSAKIYDSDTDFKSRGTINLGDNVTLIAKLGLLGDGNGALNANQINLSGTLIISYLAVDEKVMSDDNPHIFKLLNSNGLSGGEMVNLDSLFENPLYDIYSVDANNATYMVAKRDIDDIASRLNIGIENAQNIVSLLSLNQDEYEQGSSNLSKNQQSDFNKIQIEIYNLLQTPNEDNINQAVTYADSLMPSDIPVALINVLGITRQIYNITRQRLREVSNTDFEDSRVSLWVSGLFSAADYKNINELSMSGSGGVLGAEFYLLDQAKAGIGILYERSSMDIDSYSGSTKNKKSIDADALGAFIYGEYKPSNLFFDITLNYASSKYDESKSVMNIEIPSEYNSHHFYSVLSAGYDMNISEIIIVPEIGLQYIYIVQNDYQDMLGSHRRWTDNVLSGLFDIKFKKDFIGDSLTIRPFIKAGVIYDISKDSPYQSADLVNGKTISVKMQELEDFSFNAGAGLVIDILEQWNISLSYDGGFRDKYNSHNIFLIIQYNIR